MKLLYLVLLLKMVNRFKELKRNWILAQEREKELAKVHQKGVDQGLSQEKVEEAKVNCIQLFKKYFPYTDTTF